MKGYYSQEKQKRKKEKMNAVIYITLLLIIGFLVLYIYQDIEVGKQAQLDSQYEAIKTSQIENGEVELEKSISEVIDNIKDSVVGISKVKEVGDSVFLSEGVSQLGLGTGLVISSDGYILTNQHVSGRENSTCYVTLSSGKSYTGTVVWSSSDIDMAILKINEKGLSYAKFGDSDEVLVGQSVYAIGNPIGFEFQRTVTYGIISAKDRTIKLNENGVDTYMEDLLQTDATINPGNSGGPLINIHGEVIGINSVKITSAESIGFAVPINTIKPIIDSYINEGEFEEASLGIFAYDTNVIAYMKAVSNTGIYITQVNEGSTAQKNGLQNDDIILSIDNVSLERMCELRRYLYTKNPGDEVSLIILRNNKEMEIKLNLDKK